MEAAMNSEERAHRLTIDGLKALPRLPARHDPRLAVTVAGLNFPSPVGLAAGVDKDAEAPDAFLSLGFGFGNRLCVSSADVAGKSQKSSER